MTNVDAPVPVGVSAPANDLGRRARKKEATRRALSDAALALFAKVGFDETTVEDIAQAVDVATRTFHRYFARKEDSLFVDADHRVETLRVALSARPDSEPTLASIEAGVRVVMADLQKHRDREVLRASVMAASPTLQAANLAYLDGWSLALAEHVAKRDGGQPTDRWPSLVARCAVAAAGVTRGEWITNGGDLLELFAESFAMLDRLGSSSAVDHSSALDRTADSSAA